LDDGVLKLGDGEGVTGVLASVSRPAVRVREKKGKDHQSLKESLDAGFVGLGVGDVVGLAVGLSVGDFVGLAVGLSVGDFVGLEELEGSRLEVGDSEGLGVVGCVFLAIRDNQSKFCSRPHVLSGFVKSVPREKVKNT